MVFQPSTFRITIWPDASSAQNSMAAEHCHVDGLIIDGGYSGAISNIPNFLYRSLSFPGEVIARHSLTATEYRALRSAAMSAWGEISGVKVAQ